MDIIAKLEKMTADGKKVVSIDYMIKELRGIPPTRQQKVKDRVKNYSITVDGHRVIL